MRKVNFKSLAFSVTILIILSACSNSGSDATSVNGVVTGSYYEGATVYLDCNSNGVKDSTEPSVISSSSGAFTLSGDSACNIIAIIPVGAVKHEAIGDAGTSVATKLTFAAPAGTGGILSALSTKVYEKFISGSSLADAKAFVAATTGLSVDDLFKNINTITDSTLRDKIKLQLTTAETAIALNPITLAAPSTSTTTTTTSSTPTTTSSTPSTVNGSSTGIAVDPYVSQAKFYVVGSSNVAADGNCGGETSFVSNVSTSTGSFTFSDSVPLNAIVKICQDYKGYHNGKPFDSNLSSKFSTANDDGTLSPTTTIVANGMTAIDIASVLNDPNQDSDFSDGVGYPDYNVTAADIYKDPMDGLASASTDTNVTFAKIRATVAINMMMGMKSNYSMSSISDMNASGLLANSIAMMKKVLNTDSDTGSFGADKIAQVAITISDAISEVVAPVIAGGGDPTAVITAATSAIPSLALSVGTQMVMHSGKSFRLRRGSATNWSTATIVEIIPSGSELAVAGRMIEVNNDRNITFYTDGSYSELNTTSNKILWGTYFDSNNPYGVSVTTGNVNVTIVEDNVTGVLNPQPTKYWSFKGDRVSLNDASDLNITDLNSTIAFTPTSSSDLNGTKILITSDVNSSSGRTIVSRSFDTNGTYREFYGGLVYERGVWSLYEGSSDYNVTLDGTVTDVNISYVNSGSVKLNGATRAVTVFEKLQY